MKQDGFNEVKTIQEQRRMQLSPGVLLIKLHSTTVLTYSKK